MKPFHLNRSPLLASLSSASLLWLAACASQNASMPSATMDAKTSTPSAPAIPTAPSTPATPSTPAMPAMDMSMSAKPAASGLQTAGDLIVSLDARDSSAGSESWVNKGSMGNFTRVGSPKLGTAGGQPAVLFNGKSDAYRSENDTPASITGAHARTLEVWVYNPSLDSTEEAMVAWGHRGTPLGNFSFNYGSSGGWSAATLYETDLSWGEDESPAADQWHLLAFTFDGKTCKIYDNGAEKVSQDVALATAAGNKMDIAAENNAEGAVMFQVEWDNPWASSLSGYIASVRVQSGALTADQVKADFAADKARFGIKE